MIHVDTIKHAVEKSTVQELQMWLTGIIPTGSYLDKAWSSEVASRHQELVNVFNEFAENELKKRE